jgi:hypothetical protein
MAQEEYHMIKLILCFCITFTIIFSLLETKLIAREPGKISKSRSIPSFTTDEREVSSCNISNLSYWIKKDGTTPWYCAIYPSLTEFTIFADGLMWGGYVQDPIDTAEVKLRVGGQEFLPGTTAGWIEQAGDGVNPAVKVDPAHPRARLYRILRGWESLTADMASVIRDAAILDNIDPVEVTSEKAQKVIDQYAQDWNEWPVDLGAPLIDVNGNGTWDQEEGFANADQIIWLVVNDLDTILTSWLSGSLPIGLEVQITIWAYNQPDATLGQTVFKRFRIINKSGFQIDSMFIAQWVDPDLGQYSDDLVGCDIERSLGFVYNGYLNDRGFEFYNLPPPAIGYDFLQGPIQYTGNPADSAIFDFNYRSGYRNLPMTSFGYYSAGSPIDDPGEASEFYNMLRGFQPTDDLENPVPYIVGAGPDRGLPTKFPLSGDPFLQTGDIDAFGNNYAPGDRRFNLCSGPFDMAPGDTQEVVVALIGGIIPEAGGNNRNAVAQMKLNDDYTQFLYNNLFRGVPKPPAPTPAVKFTELTDKIILNWGSDPVSYKETEKNDPILGFNFEGYNIYQLPSDNATKAQATLVKTFDKINFITTIRAKKFLPEFGDIVTVPIQQGTDSGIQRYFLIEKDYINDRRLYAGNKYYFAVTAYNYNADPNVPEPSLESALNIIEVIPQSPIPGTTYPNVPGDILAVAKTGFSTGEVMVTIVDPAGVTGSNYEVNFNNPPQYTLDPVLDSLGNIVDYDTLGTWYPWNLVNNSSGETLVSGNTNLSGDNDYPIHQGLLVQVLGPKAGGLAGWDYDGERWVSGFDWSGQEFFGGLDIGANFFGSTLGLADLVPVLLEFQDQASVNANGYIHKGAYYHHPGYAYQGIMEAPFAAYDVTNINNPRRLNISFVEAADNSNAIWDMGWDDSSFADFGNREYIFIHKSDYNEGADYNDANFAPAADVLYAIWPQNRGGRPYLLAEFTMDIYAHLPNTPNDYYTFSSQSVTIGDPALAAKDVDKIKVFPNPYYAYHSQETNREERFITFTHLPEKATIRIFNLAGGQIRKLEKIPGDGRGQFFKWDLNNDSGLPVASGFYIAHIDMPDLNKTKTVKFFILQRKLF